MMKLSYTVVLEQTDADFNADGSAYTFTGVQVTATGNPQTADLQALATAMANDISAQMVAKYPVEVAQDSAAASTGGAS